MRVLGDVDVIEHNAAVVMDFGEAQMGEFARSQLDAARRDPRLERNDGRAMIADFWSAMEEAERVRTLSVMGLHEVAGAFRRARPEDSTAEGSEAARSNSVSLQALWERSAWAQAELDNGHPHINAQTLISMNSALDAMVEELARTWRGVLIDRFVELVFEQLPASPLPEAATKIELRAVAERRFPKAKRPTGSGIGRYEKPLRPVGFGAPTDRPIPSDLDAALSELGAVRDVLVHRAGRVDERALSQAPSLRYKAGEFVRVSTNDYRMYSAAVRCYAQEVTFRGIRNWPEVSDEEDGPNLAKWRDFYIIGV